MTDKKITEWYTANPLTLDPGDIFPATENTGTTPVTGAAKVSQLMFNRYKITVSVASSDLTVAMKHEDGSNPSTDRPLYFKIGDTIRAVTAALSVTKNDGTNWFNAGGTELLTQLVNYFVYIGYNATDGVTIGFARIPHARFYSDFSTTSTNQAYCAISTITNAASTDNYVNIGRFSATLSAGAAYTWSISGTGDVINYPIFTTDWLTWTPSLLGFSSNPTNTIYRYMVTHKKVEVFIRQQTAGTSNAATFSASLPFTAATITNMVWAQQGGVSDNGVAIATPGYAYVASASNTLVIVKDLASTGFTSSGGKSLRTFELRYEI